MPPFIADQLLWPYTAGQSFVTALESRGGVGEVDEALRTFPVSTGRNCIPIGIRPIERRRSRWPTSPSRSVLGGAIST